MSPLHLVAYVPVARRFDAALPQAEALSEFSCQFGTLSAIVHAGRTQAACTSRRGSECFPTLQEHRRRVCRAPRSFYRSAWLHSLQPAAALMKKLSMWTSPPSRLSRPTPANTNKTIGRAKGAFGARPALILSAIRTDRCIPEHWAHRAALAYCPPPPLRPFTRKAGPC